MLETELDMLETLELREIRSSDAPAPPPSQAEQDSPMAGTSDPNIDTAPQLLDLTTTLPEPATSDTPHPRPHSSRREIMQPHPQRRSARPHRDRALRNGQIAPASIWLGRRFETRRSGGRGAVCKKGASASAQESHRRRMRTYGELGANPSVARRRYRLSSERQAPKAEPDEPMDEEPVDEDLAGFANLNI
ncbi:MAG: hypothetical protein Q9174_007338 [Haloplaca sp. 1 TL-2023]